MREQEHTAQINRASRCIATGNLNEAEQILSRISATGPANSAGFHLARVHFRRSNFSESGALLEQFLEKNTKHRPAKLLQDGVVLGIKVSGLVKSIQEHHAAGETEQSVYLIRLLKSEYADVIREVDWTNSEILTHAAYFIFIEDPYIALANYIPKVLSVSQEYGYLDWPKRIQQHILNKSVLDVGCGFGGYGSSFMTAGATRYTGIDPAMPMNTLKAKNKRKRAVAQFPLTPTQIADIAPDITLIQGKSEDIQIDDKYDVVSLHNVTEHLIEIESVFDGIVGNMHAESDLVFLHHNYYCWNGHHMHPKTIHVYDPDNPDHKQFDEWKHIEFAESCEADHYVRTHLNRIKLDELKALIEKNFEITVWDELMSPPKVQELLNEEVLDRLSRSRSDLTKRDLEVNTVFCVARKK